MIDPQTCQQILEASPGGAIITDVRGRLVSINTRAARLLNLAADRSIGAEISSLLPETGALVMTCLATFRAQTDVPVSDNGIFLTVQVRPLASGGKVNGVLAFFRERKKPENSALNLESSQWYYRQLEAIFRYSPDGIWISDKNGVVLNINDMAEVNNGIKAGDVVGQPIYSAIEKGYIDISATAKVLETGRQASVLSHTEKTNKTLIITGNPVYDDKGELSLIVVTERDISQLNQIKRALEQSRQEAQKFKEELKELSLRELSEHRIVAESEAMRQVLRLALKLAHLGVSNILVLGESGTGKGLLAKLIHKNSKRSDRPLIQINCAALPEGLLEAELFGYEKGAFTGASDQGKPGLFELAQGGTLFLDEIGDLPLSVQAKLLKYLDDNEIMRLGGVKPIKVDCTIIAATNRHLEERIKRHKFRVDLYYRLNAFTISIPPLRERQGDILELVNHYLHKYNQAYGQQKQLSARAFQELAAHSFPGNVRELKNILKTAVVMGEGDLLDEFTVSRSKPGPALETGTPGQAKPANSLEEAVMEAEKTALLRALKLCRTTREMARYLSVSQSTVIRRLKKHRLAAP